MECAAEGVWGAAGAVCVVSSAFCGSWSCWSCCFCENSIGLGGMEGWLGPGFFILGLAWDGMGWGYYILLGEIDVHGLLYRMNEV